METKTKTKEETIVVNFLDLKQKDMDWCYKTWEKMIMDTKNRSIQEKSIYWIGILDLSYITENNFMAPLSYIDERCRIIVDQKINREVDGVRCETDPYAEYQYNFNKLHEHLLSVKKEFKFFHFFLKETVEIDGTHDVSILFLPTEETLYGFCSNTLWIDEPVKKWIGYQYQKMHDNLEKIYILADKHYNWMK